MSLRQSKPIGVSNGLPPGCCSVAQHPSTEISQAKLRVLYASVETLLARTRRGVWAFLASEHNRSHRDEHEQWAGDELMVLMKRMRPRNEEHR